MGTFGAFVVAASYCVNPLINSKGMFLFPMSVQSCAMYPNIVGLIHNCSNCLNHDAIACESTVANRALIH